MKKVIGITGASGFIGSHLIESLQAVEDVEVIALSRRVTPMMDGAVKGKVTWRRSNGFSYSKLKNSLEGIETLVYLIHSMTPTTALSQGRFCDFDLYLAYNYAKAAQAAKVQRIIYLSGLVPKGENEEELSQHLQSRLEVERVLESFGNSLTILRSGLIIGKNASSFPILERLIRRLPVLVCPSWTLSKTQPIDIKDVLKSIIYCIFSDHTKDRLYDIGGPKVLSYLEMLKQTATVLAKNRLIVTVPFFSAKLSKLWVTKVTGIDSSLVYPLIDSLKHNMVVRKTHQLVVPGHNYTSFNESLANAINRKRKPLMRWIFSNHFRINFSWLENVTSIQRFGNPHGWSGEQIALLYFGWLKSFLRPWIDVDIDDSKRSILFKIGEQITLLKIERSEHYSEVHRSTYFVKSGLLVRNETCPGRLEFCNIEREKLAVVALLDYCPSIPWFIYKFTQALLHLWVMRRFKGHLRLLSLKQKQDVDRIQ